ncbi:hypothetical protein Gotri_013879 [Gossypium trilobum]|uniref:Disease resistance N-terminal domain-containing protein n=1 Tax=Gossypium trilobum TaxID=34281 RepID=A0A7J9DUV5_9ROSI|nr:hypothetical protein [Gossypium trilobum]
MAEAFVSAVVGEVASKAASVAVEMISLGWGFKDEMQRLGNSLEMIGAFLRDAEGNQKQMNSVKLWLKRLRDVAYEADEVLDEIAYEFLRRKVEIGDQMWRKLRDTPSTVTFQHNMADKVKDILNSLDDLNKIAKDYVNNRDGVITSVWWIARLTESTDETVKSWCIRILVGLHQSMN